VSLSSDLAVSTSLNYDEHDRNNRQQLESAGLTLVRKVVLNGVGVHRVNKLDTGSRRSDLRPE